MCKGLTQHDGRAARGASDNQGLYQESSLTLSPVRSDSEPQTDPTGSEKDNWSSSITPGFM